MKPHRPPGITGKEEGSTWRGLIHSQIVIFPAEKAWEGGGGNAVGDGYSHCVDFLCDACFLSEICICEFFHIFSDGALFTYVWFIIPTCS